MSKKTPKLNAENLKSKLWQTLNDVQCGDMDAKTANAIAGQARGIISTINAEIQIQNAAHNLSATLGDFAGVSDG